MSTKGDLMLFVTPVVTSLSVRRLMPVAALLLSVLLSVSVACAAEIGKVRTATDMAGNVVVEELEFKKADVQDAVRIISELSGVNIVATGEAGKKRVTFFIRKQTVAEIVDCICRLSGLWYRHNPKSGVFILMTTEEYQRDIVVFRNEPIKSFQLKYLNVAVAARTIADLYGDRVELQGKANWDTGDDYAISGLDSEIENDDGDDDDDSNSNSNSGNGRNNRNNSDNRNNRSNDGSGSRSGRTEEKLNLTSAQLALLEQKAKTELQIPEGMLRQLTERKTAPIYVTINRQHNILFVRTSDEKALTEIAKVVQDSDRQVPEVLLEMKVLEVQLNDKFESAFTISTISGGSQTGPDDGQVANPLNTAASAVGSTLLGMGNFALNSESTLTYQFLSSDLRLRLQLLQQNNNLTTIATPMLMAANNHPARLFIGEETVLTTGFTTMTSTSTTTSGVVVNNTLPVPVTETKSVGNTLTILPSINADRSVVMRIVHENSSVKTNGASIPLPVGTTVQTVSIDTVNTSKLEGTVLAQDGMTVAVGGMMRTNITDYESKVPLLGDIPYLGFFFKQKQKIKTKTELVLLITPYILQAPNQGEAVTRRRLNDLSGNTGEINSYMDKLEQERSATGTSRTDAANRHAEPPADVVGGKEQGIAELIKTAAVQVRQPLSLRQPVGAVRPAPLDVRGEVQVFTVSGVAALPTAAWSDGRHFVTALKVVNRTGRELKLDVTALRGVWAAATLERQELAPAGRDGDSTWLYLVSETGFEKVIAGSGSK